MNLLKILLLVLIGMGVLSGCSQVDLLNATIPTVGYTTIKDIPFKDGARGKLDIYLPDHLAAGHPVVMFTYGGSWKEGSKDDYLFFGEAMASKGIITVIADYRIYPQVTFPAFMEDTAEALAWTHNHIRNYGGNPKNIFVVGHSAGAYNAVMLTLNPLYLKAAGGSPHWITGTIGIAGPYDFLPLTDPILIRIFNTHDLATTQPINFVGPSLPPLLLLTGDEDEDVLPQNSITLAKALKSYGNDVVLKTYPGLAHIGIILAFADGFRGKAPVLEDSVTFIKAHTISLAP